VLSGDEDVLRLDVPVRHAHAQSAWRYNEQLSDPLGGRHREAHPALLPGHDAGPIGATPLIDLCVISPRENHDSASVEKEREIVIDRPR
jgi:hypothetical protein